MIRPLPVEVFFTLQKPLFSICRSKYPNPTKNESDRCLKHNVRINEDLVMQEHCNSDPTCEYIEPFEKYFGKPNDPTSLFNNTVVVA